MNTQTTRTDIYRVQIKARPNGRYEPQSAATESLAEARKWRTELRAKFGEARIRLTTTIERTVV